MADEAHEEEVHADREEIARDRGGAFACIGRFFLVVLVPLPGSHTGKKGLLFLLLFVRAHPLARI